MERKRITHRSARKGISDRKFLRLNYDSRHWRVDRVLANHSLGSTASQGTSNIPFPWFLLSQCNRQARNQERSTIMCLAEEHFSSVSLFFGALLSIHHVPHSRRERPREKSFRDMEKMGVKENETLSDEEKTDP